MVHYSKQLLLLLLHVAVIILLAASTICFAEATEKTSIVEFVPGAAVDKVIALRQNNFKAAIEDPANPLWLLKFYAPWCGHCKKMAPVLDRLAPRLTGTMSIGKIDCTIEQKLCSEHQIRGYPTLKYSLDGRMHDYPGGRTESDIISFSKRMLRPDVQIVTSIESVNAYVTDDTDDGVAFVCYHPQLKGKTLAEKLSSTRVTQVYNQVARQFKASGHFLLLDITSLLLSLSSSNNNDSDSDTRASKKKEQLDTVIASFGQSTDHPFICRFETDVTTRCYTTSSSSTIKSFDDSISMEELSQFVNAWNVPTVTQFTALNFHRIGRRGRPLVIGVTDTTSDSKKMKQALTKYATSSTTSIEKYYYGVFDGRQWAKFLAQFDVLPEQLPQVFVLDLPKKKYWQNATYGSRVLENDGITLDEYLSAVENGTIPYRFAGKKGFVGTAERAIDTFIDYLPWSAMAGVSLLFLVVIGVFLCITPTDDLKPPYLSTNTSPPNSGQPPVIPEEAKTEEIETKKEK